jgi:DNA-binding transcriptional LysR family regulator
MQASETLRWEDVRVFLAAYRERTLAEAAARLGVDASTVSRRIAALEDVFGARLFDRTRDGLVATQAAEIVLAGAEEMEAGHQRLLREASSLESVPEGVVRLSVPPGMADAFMGPALVRLHERHPRIRIALDASVRVLDLTRREADLALRTIRPEGGDLILTKVHHDEWIAMAAPGYAADLGRLRSWDDARWIAWGEDLSSIPAARWLAKHVKNAPVLATSHMATQLAAAAAGLGVVLAPNAYQAVKTLVPVRFSSALEESAAEWPSDDLWLVGHRALRGVPRVDVVWKFLIEEFTTDPAKKKAKR